ncbi:hypothetical protein [Leifsonia shinshuensis]|uniref:Multidrug ABC transporter ATPase n=1 Tax=Leifsonia shinshuensis TaxID=150026 RepID=A0A7G6YFN6_9MICO|nr:hypothetical protein [Leifsonia shinshuensis]QNE37301.1 hypothetical protein F1C12_20725 [Leifsonia shinshuensis]
MTSQTPPPASRLQRVLSYIVAALVVVSLVCIAAILVGSALGGMPQQGSGQGLWPAVFLFPLIALPIAFVLLITLIIVTGRQRSRAAKAASGKNRR